MLKERIVVFAKRILKSILRRDKIVLRLQNLVKYKKNVTHLIEQESLFLSTGPNNLNSPVKTRDVKVPALNIYRFDDALVHCNSSCIVYKNRLIKEYLKEGERFNEGFIVSHTRRVASIKKLNVIVINEGFFLAGNGCWNWYHWLIEILPRVIFLDKVKVKTLLVSECLLEIPSMMDTLRVVAGDDVRIYFMNKSTNYLVNRFYYLNSISYIPFNLEPGTKIRIEDSFVRGDIIKCLRDKLLRYYSDSCSATPLDKIFLYRSNSRVPKNQNELFYRLEKEGFRKVDFSELGIEHQIFYMQHAKIVIGVTGASFTNLIFAKPGTKFICLMQEGLEEVSCFSNLAILFGVQLYYYFYSSNNSLEMHYLNDFNLDIDEIVTLYNKVIAEPEIKSYGF